MRSRAPNRGFATWLALFALAFQLIVSFGHVHLDGIHLANRAAITGQVAKAQPLPAQSPGDDDDGYCAICASIYLASNSFVPQAPPLPVPFVTQRVEHFEGVIVVWTVSRRAPFQSRAPPLA